MQRPTAALQNYTSSSVWPSHNLEHHEVYKICKFCSTDKRIQEAQHWRVAAVWVKCSHTGVPSLALGCNLHVGCISFNHTTNSELKIVIIIFLLSLEENKTHTHFQNLGLHHMKPWHTRFAKGGVQNEGPDLTGTRWTWHSVIPLPEN